MLEPRDGLGPDTTIGLGLARADLGHIETVPRSSMSYGRILDGLPGGEREIAQPDLFSEDGLDPRHREVAARLGTPPAMRSPCPRGGRPARRRAVWFYGEPAEPVERQRHLVGLYVRYAAEHLARMVEIERTRVCTATIVDELLPARLPRSPASSSPPGATPARGGGDGTTRWCCPRRRSGLAVGSVTGSDERGGRVGPAARLTARVRGDGGRGSGGGPVGPRTAAEITEPARGHRLFAYCEPALRKLTLAGAGHSPPLVVGPRRTEFVETSLSAPLGMLACWEAPSIEVTAEPGETVLLYTDGLLHRTGDPMDRAFARLHAAAASVPRPVRTDPGAIADHVLRSVLPDGLDQADSAEDVVLLAARFE